MSGSSKEKTTTSSSTTPWAPQAGALTTAFSGALDAYGRAKGANAPTDFVSQFTPEQLANFRSMIGYGSNNAIPGQNAATGSALSTAGAGATTGALSGLSSFDPSAANNPNTLVDAANKYVAGQDINAQVNDAMLNARQTARDVTLPGIEQNAAVTGNTNSSRTGIAQGLVERGLAEQSGNLGASLRSGAFKDGLTLAASNAAANNASKLGALSTAATAGTDAARAGVGANSASIGDQSNLFGLADAGGSGLQGSQQAFLDNLLKRYQSQVSSPYDAVNALMGVVGTNMWGSNTNSTSEKESTPSAWQVAGGLLGAGGSAASTAGNLGWKPFA
jgi:hypothetical protein